MKNYFKILLSNSNQASSRRFIAITLLPFYMVGIVLGFIIAYKTSDFKFFIASLLSAGLPQYLTYFSLTWEHVKEILSTNAFKKNTNGLYDFSPEELKDP